MALAVCLLFDKGSERLLRDLWDRLAHDGVSTLAHHTHGRHHPHLSYAVLRAWHLGEVQAALADVPHEGPLEIGLHGMLVFPRGRAALAPAVTGDVVRRQRHVVDAVTATGADLHRNYEPGRWVPHVSVATSARGSQLSTVANAIADVLPMTVRVDRAALIDGATGEVWLLPHIP